MHFQKKENALRSLLFSLMEPTVQEYILLHSENKARTLCVLFCFLSWSRLSGLNRRPTVYKTVALPTELSRHTADYIIIGRLFNNFRLLSQNMPEDAHKPDKSPAPPSRLQYVHSFGKPKSHHHLLKTLSYHLHS